MIRRTLLLVLSPLWLTAAAVLALVSGLRSTGHWVREGRWLLADELPPARLDRTGRALESWVERMAK